MQTKLTLTVDQEVILRAKEYARDNQRSLSNIVEEYLKTLSSRKPMDKRTKFSKIVKQLKGSVKDQNPSKSYKEILQEKLIEKHLK